MTSALGSTSFRSTDWLSRGRRINQFWLLVIVVVIVFVLCSVLVQGFFSMSNLQNALVGQIPLAILGLAIAITIIGGAVDFSVLVVAVCSAQVVMSLAANEVPLAVALLGGLGFAVLIGVLNGVIVAFVDLPSLVVTIGMSLLVMGVARLTFFGEASQVLPAQAGGIRQALGGSLLGVPAALVVLVIVAVALQLVLSRSVPGRFLYAKGDNAEAARLSGIAIRVITVGAFIASAGLAFVAGLVMAAQGGALASSQGTSAMLYDIITVAVIGGVSLAGGRGGVAGVLVGALLVALLLNALTLLDFSENQKVLVKGVVLLTALAMDAVLHPRSLEDLKPGDL
ncbi:ABC transporter permease [Cryobacterium sp. TMS1-20-1]|uniref:ABC transporter permease n=1 Tax=Cryobacterium sp. TMS1-20-1 TaxID=1259223 RepID=UPI0010699E65|nr:ABC transporter permease [Cryobacterium sp. TMS1-20-1]TFC80529.1 ABC transporter permease [Cryobacterium sp. TMS1-20-1]